MPMQARSRLEAQSHVYILQRKSMYEEDGGGALHHKTQARIAANLQENCKKGVFLY